MTFIGDCTCKYNALSSEIRCAVNPDGPCEGCRYFEPCRERIMLAGNPIVPLTRRERLVNQLKVKMHEVWAVAQCPVRIIQISCTLTFLGLLFFNKYPISKEHFLELFSFNVKMVGFLYSLIREYKTLKEYCIYSRHRNSRHRTFLREIFWVLEPLTWAAVIESIAKVVLKSS